MKTPEIGTISHGTMRTQDLISAFLDAVLVYAPEKETKPVPVEAWLDDDHAWWSGAGRLLLRGASR